MTPETPRHFYTRRAMLELAGIGVNTFKIWCRRGWFQREAEIRGSHERYSERDVLRLSLVAELKQRGFTLQAATRLARTAELAFDELIEGRRDSLRVVSGPIEIDAGAIVRQAQERLAHICGRS